MQLRRINLEHEYLVDMITNNGFLIKKEERYGSTDVDVLINSSKFTDSEYRCDCGAFIGQDIIGQVCPRCGTEITLHSLNFEYTGWVDISPHKVISPIYYNILKRVLGNNMLKFILGDYKSDFSVQYNENDVNFEENKKSRKTGIPNPNDLAYIIKRITGPKRKFQGVGHDGFYERFEEILTACAPKGNEDVPMLLEEKEAVFTSKIPIYSTAFRPVSKTSETMFYPRINKWFSMIVAIYCKLEDMILPIETIQALNCIQNYWVEATEHLIKNEISKKEGFVRSEIVGGTFSFSARSVIILDNSLRGDGIDLPLPMLIIAYQYKIAHILASQYNMTLEQAYLYVQDYEDNPLVVQILQQIIDEGQYVFMIREPTINFASIELMKIRRFKINDDTMSIPPEVLKGLNADFDGDQLDICFLPKEIVPDFEPFHFSYMMDMVSGKVDINCLEWHDVCWARLSM